MVMVLCVVEPGRAWTQSDYQHRGSGRIFFPPKLRTLVGRAEVGFLGQRPIQSSISPLGDQGGTLSSAFPLFPSKASCTVL